MCFKKKCLPGLGSSIISIIFMVLLLKRLVQLVSYSLDSVHPETQKKLFRFHEETYHFGLFMIGLRLESLNGIKPCISTNACMGKESHFILIKQYHFIQKKSATVQQATAILDWNPTFYLQLSRNPQLFYILKQGSHSDFAVFFNCLCSVVSS